MNPLNYTEENYLKSIWNAEHLAQPMRITQATLAREHKHSRASAHKVVHKLTDCGYVRSEEDGTLKLTKEGQLYGVTLVRQHRLWEVFLVDKLGYNWAEVHEIAEKLEHIGDRTLTERLEHFLNSPRFDPHGDPIPDQDGRMETATYFSLSDWPIGKPCIIVGVREQSTSFLEFMQMNELALGTQLAVLNKMVFDGSLFIERISKGEEHRKIHLSPFAADHIIVGES